MAHYKPQSTLWNVPRRRWYLAFLFACSMLSNAAQAAPPFLLVVYASGGWDQTMVFDDKTDAQGVQTQTGLSKGSGGGAISYQTHADRPAVRTFFTDYGDRSAIVNGLFIGGMDRYSAQKQLLSVIPQGKSRAVEWATLYADSSGFSGELPYVNFAAPFAPGEYLAKATHLSAATIADYLTVVPSSTDLGASGEAALKALRSAAMAKVITKIAANSLDFDKLNALTTGYANEAKIAAQLATAVKAVGTQGSSDTFTYQAKLALKLFHQGATIAATVQAGRSGAWTTSKANFSLQSAAFQTLFADLAIILTYAKKLGLSDKLTLVVMSEGGRAPRLNEDAGKGPWPYTSMLLWGATINGGKVVGLTDGNLRGIPIDPIFGGAGKDSSVMLTPANVWSALYTKAGFDTGAMIGPTPALAQVIK